MAKELETMCKLKPGSGKITGAIAVSAFLVVAMATVNNAVAQCGTGVGATLGLKDANGADVNASTYLHIGDKVFISGVNVANAFDSYRTTNLLGTVVFPNATSHPSLSIVELSPGPGCNAVIGRTEGWRCPAGTPVVNAPIGPLCLPGVNDVYTVAFADIATSAAGFLCDNATHPPAKSVLFKLAVSGKAINENRVFTGDASACSSIFTTVIFPCITITKDCDSQCTPYGQPIKFHGTVSNTGDTPLANVTVIDTANQPGTVSAITFDNVQPGNRVWDKTLAPGESAVYHGTFTPTDSGGTSLCGPFSDTVQASALDLSGTTIWNTNACINPTTGVSSGPRPPVTALCHVQVNPGIDLTKECYKEGQPGVKLLQAGDRYVDVFTVTNTGNVPLKDVSIQDSSTRDGNRTFQIGNLALKGTAILRITNGPITAQNIEDACKLGITGVTNIAKAYGTNICPFDATCPANPPFASAGPVSCFVYWECKPAVCIGKQVTCGPTVGGTPCGDSKDYREYAAGTGNNATQQFPLFCYRISITNCGFQVLTNLVLVDKDLGDPNNGFQLLLPKTTLAVNEVMPPIYGSKTWPSTGNFTNTAIVTGNGAISGAGVTNKDTAAASINNVAVTCKIILTSQADMDGNLTDNHLLLPPEFAGTTISDGYTLVVSNAGDVKISVKVVETPVGVTLDACDPAVTNGFTLEVGGVTNLVCDLVNIACPGPDNISVTVTATPNDERFPCIYDVNGKVITATADCTARIDCTTPVTCRVTGGGTLYDGDTNMDCVLTTTTLKPLFSAGGTGIPLDHISHGGQLGAPFSHMDCANRLADPCIRGQWQHNRHFVGQGNPRDVFNADFHSNTPKGLYDTLMCACLGCCPGDTDKKGPNGQFNGIGNHFTVCNADDHRACGPMPRPAPANAIIFTGIGTFKPTDDSNKPNPSEWVVFRVYIEDRSEPGGSHPKGSVDPADIYVFQAWRTGISVDKRADGNALPSNGLLGNVNAFRLALSQDSCDFINGISVGGPNPPGTLPLDIVKGYPNLPADISDKGALHSGNHQIHPSTSATCNE
jgi:uncharacterized repeat protein (TIGR01451 family)